MGGKGRRRKMEKEGKGSSPRPLTNRENPTKPFIFYFSLMIDAYETTT